MLLELFSEPCVYLLFAGVLMKKKTMARYNECMMIKLGRYFFFLIHLNRLISNNISKYLKVCIQSAKF